MTSARNLVSLFVFTAALFAGSAVPAEGPHRPRHGPDGLRFDPLTYLISGAESSRCFQYGVLYPLAQVVFGLRMPCDRALRSRP